MTDIHRFGWAGQNRLLIDKNITFVMTKPQITSLGLIVMFTDFQAVSYTFKILYCIAGGAHMFAYNLSCPTPYAIWYLAAFFVHYFKFYLFKSIKKIQIETVYSSTNINIIYKKYKSASISWFWNLVHDLQSNIQLWLFQNPTVDFKRPRKLYFLITLFYPNWT